MSVPVFEIPKNTPALGPKSIHYVESEFQHLLASYSPGKIFNSGRVGITRKVLQTLRLLIEIGVSRPVVVVYDHRTVLGIFLASIGYNKVLVAEDGLHTLVVDEYGPRHLYRNCHWLKAHLMRLFSIRILSMRRYRALPLLIEDLKQLDLSKRTNMTSVRPVFIDQPLIDTFADRSSIIRDLCKSGSDVKIALHPRGDIKTLSFLAPSQVVHFGDLREGITKFDHFIGVYSTVLLVSACLGLETSFVALSSNNVQSKQALEELEYAKACQAVIKRQCENQNRFSETEIA